MVDRGGEPGRLIDEPGLVAESGQAGEQGNGEPGEPLIGAQRHAGVEPDPELAGGGRCARDVEMHLSEDRQPLAVFHRHRLTSATTVDVRVAGDCVDEAADERRGDEDLPVVAGFPGALLRVEEPLGGDSPDSTACDQNERPDACEREDLPATELLARRSWRRCRRALLYASFDAISNPCPHGFSLPPRRL